MSRWMTTAAVVALVACGGKDDDDSGTLITDTAIGGTIPTDAPVIRNCDAVCRRVGDVGTSFFQWQFSCIYEDPQGNDTVQAFGDVRVEQNGETVTNLRAVCGPRGDGTPLCDGAWGADDIFVSCQSEPESYTWILTVFDIDGNSGEGQAVGRAEG